MSAIAEKAKIEPPASGHEPSGNDYLATNPSRPSDWRWQRAGQLLEPRRRRRRRDDDWVVSVRAFRTALAKVGNDIRHPRLARAQPEILGAYLAPRGGTLLRSEVEARLLAGQGDADIAGRVGIEAGVVAAYAAIFFDVRTRLECSDWIAAHVLGGRLYEGFDVADTETVWKVLGFQHGPLVLDALIANLHGNVPRPVEAGLAESLRLLALVTAMPATHDNAIEILRLNALVRGIDRAETTRSVAEMNKPILVPPIEVHLGPETVPLVRAGCAPQDDLGNDPGIENGPIGLSDAC